MPLKYTLEVKDAPSIPGEGKPRRHFIQGDKPLLSAPEGINSLYENFLRGVKLAGDDPFLGHRTVVNGEAGEYEWESYNKILERVKNFGAGLIHLGLKANDTLGLYSVNRREWVIGEQASYMYEFITVPLYDTLGAEAVEYVVSQAELRFICLTQDKTEHLLNMREALPGLEHLIVMDALTDNLVTLAAEKKIKLHLFTDVEKLGVEHPTAIGSATLDSVATICYTSGTTGLPKGVVLTHRNILAEVGAINYLMEQKRFYRITKADSYISYLPLAHVLERVVIQVLIYYGARLGFYQGDTLKLLDDLAVLKPTVFVSVPRLFNRIFDKVWATVTAKGGFGAYLFKRAVRTKTDNLATGSTNHWLWDRLVFGKLKQSLGGNVKVIVSGSAPLSAEVMDFVRIAFNAQMYEGYGQTETSAAVTFTDIDDTKSGHVGSPFPCSEIKLLDVPEMGYSSLDKPCPRGEVCTRGNNIFTEYYKDPKRTKETFIHIEKDGEMVNTGWCRSGDVGMWDEQGRLIIIDRVKNLFKLAQGEYVAPERVENIYSTHPIVTQAFVTGNSLESCTVGVIVPDEDSLKALLQENSIDTKRDIADIYQDPAAQKLVVRELTKFAKKHDAKGFECIKHVHLEASPFSVENGLLSPTFKLKRKEAQAYYMNHINAMYEELKKK
ncbi:medium-chain fatty acid-CoA ligase faa2 [Dimargaris verticillata]|uniref:Medium-chain fatty acid-CoA ligase faa2 n=1 Tax=Dimargaris verticillata TaxID=2761393 RepID=A0A9W8E9A7_9FUNG|nr:medium-chain fatty acid-CoA ligase faa2 [Dimargaris verticillata]